MRLKPGSIPVVYAVLPLQFNPARQIARGVRNYARTAGRWEVRLPEYGDLRVLAAMRGHTRGVIAWCRDTAIRNSLRALRVPVVNLSQRVTGFPCVLYDNAAIGQMAADHLIDLGYKHFVFVAYDELKFNVERQAGFEGRIREAGLTVHPALVKQETRPTALFRLPRPLAVMGNNDEAAEWVIRACINAKVSVPDEIAVIGANNDDTICETASVPLSSVDPNPELLGYEAAALLDRMMAGGKPPATALRISPLGVVERTSTSILAIEDPIVRFAVGYIRQHACDGMGTDHILRNVDVSRRTLEKRFVKVRGRTVHEEIRRVQLDHACNLLRGTHLPVPEVASQSGIADPKQFYAIFRQTLGTTPMAYRKRTLLNQHSC
jgi:LacI family transcriptional regulator